MRRSMVGLVGALVSVPLIGLAPSALGISFGERDGYRHPNVVSLRYVQPSLDAFSAAPAP